MPISLRHKFTCLVPDDGDSSRVRPSNWNDEHALVQSSNRILGRRTAGAGDTEELTPADVLAMIIPITTTVGRLARFTNTASGIDQSQMSEDALGNVSVPGVFTAINGVRLGGTTTIWTAGTGTPEGVVAAPVGSLFARTDGTVGTTLYSKESGAGNTGWVPVGLQDNSVTTAKIVDQAVDGTKLANNSVGPSKIAPSGVATANIQNSAVTLGKMADLADSTVIGRAAGAGTGVPTALTATQATAILNSFVGDSGSGGAKGLVPAPSAGDAAAGRVLLASGVWGLSPVGATPVATRTAMAALNTAATTVAYLTEAGRHGLFRWVSSNLSAQVVNDPGQGVYVPPASDVTGASGAWSRSRNVRQCWMEWFGVQSLPFSSPSTPAETAANTAVETANATAIQRAINFVNSEAGGELLFGGFYSVNSGLMMSGNDVVLKGLDQSSGITTKTEGIQLLTVSGARCRVESLLLFYNVWTSNAGSFCLWLNNAVKFRISDCRVYGGYYPIAITGEACADTYHDNTVYSFSTGPSQAYLVRAGVGVNGAHHFHRCLFNLDYPGGQPTSGAAFRGVWAASTVYAVGDLVTVRGGLWRLQCVAASGTRTSGSTEPFGIGNEVWYGTNIIDNPGANQVVWQLTAFAGLEAVTVDSGITWTFFNGCDITGPYFHGVRYKNTVPGGDKPFNIHFEAGNTIHGPLFKGMLMDSALQCAVVGLDTFGPYFASNVGIEITSGAEDIVVDRITLRGYVDGVSNAGPKTRLVNSSITGCTTGLRVKAGTSNTKAHGNNLGSRTIGGANVNAVVIEAGTTNRTNISDNDFTGATNGLVNSSTGTNNVFRDNTPV